MMKTEDIETLLDKYMRNETNVEEERTLAEYFRTHDVPEAWKPYKVMFSYEQSGLDADRILAEDHTAEFDAVVARRRRLRLSRWVAGCAAAAAVIVILLVMVFSGKERTTIQQPLPRRESAEARVGVKQTVVKPSAQSAMVPASHQKRVRHHVRSVAPMVVYDSKAIEARIRADSIAAEQDKARMLAEVRRMEEERERRYHQELQMAMQNSDKQEKGGAER